MHTLQSSAQAMGYRSTAALGVALLTHIAEIMECGFGHSGKDSGISEEVAEMFDSLCGRDEYSETERHEINRRK